MLVTLVMLATCFGLLCGIGILFGIVGLLLKFGGKVLRASKITFLFHLDKKKKGEYRISILSLLGSFWKPV